MSARCASCRYPLSVCDSVACLECRSHFHIDCAQLVGFPLFELSAEPGKNIFHCSTCQLLPLPVPRSDSDTSDDEGMPSRQLDYTLEGDSECGKDMNEIKGTIQDLSDLCKDMLREINDLKSINLTLRCCIENVRHDNEQRDVIINELKRRLDLLEGKKFDGQIVETFDKLIGKEVESTKVQINETSIQNISYDQKSAAYKQELFSKYTTTSKEETEGYELEETSPKVEISESLIQNISYDQTSAAYKKDVFSKNTTTSKEETEGYELEESLSKVEMNESLIQKPSYDQKSAAYKKDIFSKYTTTSKEETEGYELEESSSLFEKEEDSQKDKWDGNKQQEDAELGYSDNETDNEDEKETEKDVYQAKELVKAEIISETKESRQDWSWKGTHAVEVNKQDEEVEESEEEETEDESEDDNDDRETPSWKKLKEEIESAIQEDDNIESSVEIEEIEMEEKEESWKVRKSVTWDENIETESETETEFSQKGQKHEDQSEAETETLADDDVTDEVGSVAEVEDRLELGDEELRLESRQSVIEEEHRLETEEIFSEEPILEVGEVLAEGESRLEGDGALLAEGEPHSEGDLLGDEEPRPEGDLVVDGEPRLEGNVMVDGELGLEGDILVDGEPRLDGEATEDGELRLEGTEFPDEEEVQPPESPPPQHTEEDLWLYLKENVSSVHPSTVQEFVQNLIGTLQHVPEEYLKPVIDANIKRANSPSVTDGERLPTPEGIQSEEGEVLEDGSTMNNQDVINDNALDSSDFPTTGEDFPASTQEVSSDHSGVTSVVEAAD